MPHAKTSDNKAHLICFNVSIRQRGGIQGEQWGKIEPQYYMQIV